MSNLVAQVATVAVKPNCY